MTDDPELPEPLILGKSFVEDSFGVTFTPFIDNQFGTAGHIADHPDGRREYIYLNPSNGDTDVNVFLYHEADEVALMGACHYYLMFEESHS